MVKSGLPTEAMSLIPKPGHRNQNSFVPGLLAKLLCQLKAIHLGHADVKKDDMGAVGSGLFQSRHSVVMDLCLMAPQLNQDGQAVGGIPVVIDNQHTQVPPI